MHAAVTESNRCTKGSNKSLDSLICAHMRNVRSLVKLQRRHRRRQEHTLRTLLAFAPFSAARLGSAMATVRDVCRESCRAAQGDSLMRSDFSRWLLTVLLML